MPLAENLEAAERAVAYVKSWNLQSSNKKSDRIAAAGGIENVGAGQGTRLFKLTPDGRRLFPLGPAGVGVGDVRKAFGAMQARAANLGAHVPLGEEVALYTTGRFGNCYEQARIAVWFLLERGIHPLDLMSFSYLMKPQGYDHVWVVVGLDPGWQRTNLRSWGADAVWCDPWQGDGVAFPITDLIQRKVINLNNQYNCHTAELVEHGWPCSKERWN